MSVFAVLLLVDLAFVLMHNLNNHGEGWRGHFQNERFSIERDGGYSEIFGYGKQALAVLALGLAFWLTRELVYGAWGFAIFVTVLDDSLQLHEKGGDELGDLVERTSLFDADFSGELAQLLVWGMLAVLVVPGIVLAHRRSTGQVRRDSLVLLGLFAALVALAVVVDLINIILDEAFDAGAGAGYRAALEDGGEQVILSAFAAYAVWIAVRTVLARREASAPAGSAATSELFRLDDGRVVTVSQESARQGFAPSADGSKTVVCTNCLRTRSAGTWSSLRLSRYTSAALAKANLLERDTCTECRERSPASGPSPLASS